METESFHIDKIENFDRHFNWMDQEGASYEMDPETTKPYNQPNQFSFALNKH